MRRVRRFARRFGLGRAIGLALLAVLLLVRYWDPPSVVELRLRSFDFYQVVKPRDARFRPVVIVDIDEKSLQAYGQWPWPRTLVADLVNRLTDLGAAAIGFDVLFSEPDRTSPANVARLYRGLDDETRSKLAVMPSNDDVFAQAIRRSRVVLGQSGDGIPQAKGRPVDLIGFIVKGPRMADGKAPDPTPYLDRYPVLLTNIPVLEQAAAGRGLFSFHPDRDGIVRRAPLAMSAAGATVPALATEMIRVATNTNSPVITVDEGGIKSVGIPGYELPTDGQGRLWVYFGRHDKARYVSAKDVIDGTVPKDRFAQRLAIVGTSAIGLLDLKTTPVDGAMPGVEVHAQILEAALARSIPPNDPRYSPVSFLDRPYWTTLLEMTGMFAAGVAIVALAPLIGALPLLLVGAVGSLVMIEASWLLFVMNGLLIDVTFPLIATFSVYVVLVFVNYFREQAGRQRVRSAFGQYLSPTLVEQLAQSPDKLVLGGEERIMTIMFSDVRGFTTISESFKDDPQGLTHLMNRLLTPLSNAILDRNGTIDKYMGDAIMAFWNAPIDDPQHEANACEAALEMLDRLEALNEQRMREAEQSGQPFLNIKIGIGLNTGRCTVGNMGSDMRFQYTVLGDSVNLASRIEGQTKSYGVPILIGANTARAVQEKFVLLELDRIKVKGKTEPETIYTVLGRPDSKRAGTFAATTDTVTRFLACYRAQDWDGALAILAASRAAEGTIDFDAFADLYSARIEAFKLNPPGRDWDGVFALQTK
jgi:adenylate cyclase